MTDQWCSASASAHHITNTRDTIACENQLTRRNTQVHQHWQPPNLSLRSFLNSPTSFASCKCAHTPTVARRCPCVPLLRLRAFHGFTRQRKSAWRKGGGPLHHLSSFPSFARPGSTSHNTNQRRGPLAPSCRGPLCNPSTVAKTTNKQRPPLLPHHRGPPDTPQTTLGQTQNLTVDQGSNTCTAPPETPTATALKHRLHLSIPGSTSDTMHTQRLPHHVTASVFQTWAFPCPPQHILQISPVRPWLHPETALVSAL